MKYTIEGFSQEKLLELELDCMDALLLRYFVDFKDSGKMVSKMIDEEKYYWVKYEGVDEQLPILKLKKDSVYRRFKKLAEKGILKHKTVKKNGVYSYYTIGEKYSQLICDTSDSNPNTSEINPKPYGNKSDTHTDLNPEQNINLLNNNKSIKNIYTKEFLEWYSLYPNPWNKQQSFKNFKKLLKNESYENLMIATKNYIEYLKKKGKTDRDFMVRSTNFIGEKQEYKGYLEMQEVVQPKVEQQVRANAAAYQMI